ncbi:hypothetical protein [Streptomyces sp. 4F14]|uniref:deazapurine DNA modification protein DpdA family protein n=1 Tax=Streptomyces sp. 4F14 TaxID=3394380 RepID=UPI003A8487D5
MTEPTLPLFFLGAKPHFLAHTDVPLFIAHPHLADRRTLPRARGPFAVDSGGFTQLSREGTWDTGPSPRAYVQHLRRYRDEIGNLLWAAPQDWMCEDAIIHGGQAGSQFFPGTGLSVEEHLHRTVGNYLDLRGLDPDLPIIPVVQGRRPSDYAHCVDLYEQAGINLLNEPLVGIGSVCRIQATEEAVEIVETVTGILGPARCHGFGFKITGLRKSARRLRSADSHAWSAQGRRIPARDCTFRLPRSYGPHQNEANCLRYALTWRRRVLSAIETGLRTPHLPSDVGETA